MPSIHQCISLPWVGTFLAGIDGLTEGFKNVMQVLAPLGTVLYDVAAHIQNVESSLFNILKTVALNPVSPIAMMLQAVPGGSDILKSMRDFQLPMLPLADPRKAADWANNLPTTNLANWWEEQRGSGKGGKWADRIDQMVDGGTSQANGLLDKVGEKLDQFEKATSGNGRQFDNLMRQQVDLSRQMVDKLGQPVELQGGFDWNNYNKFMADADARLVRNVHRAASRAAG